MSVKRDINDAKHTIRQMKEKKKTRNRNENETIKMSRKISKHRRRESV